MAIPIPVINLQFSLPISAAGLSCSSTAGRVPSTKHIREPAQSGDLKLSRRGILFAVDLCSRGARAPLLLWDAGKDLLYVTAAAAPGFSCWDCHYVSRLGVLFV